MKGEKRGNMRRDCARLMAGAIVATCLECLLGMAAPTVVSLLLGDMADALLALDVVAIGARFPAFLGGILVTVLVAPGMTLVKNLLLTRQGTAYDMFLMESTLGLPHKSLHQVDAGDYLHRFEVDRTLYYCCVVRLLGSPPARMRAISANSCTSSLPSSRYMAFRVVISSSPRALGLTCLA